MEHYDVFKGPFKADECCCYIWCNGGTQMCFDVMDGRDAALGKRIAACLNDEPGAQYFDNVGVSADGQYICDGHSPLLCLRGWGYLTGTGGLNLPAKEARRIQDEFVQWAADRLQEQGKVERRYYIRFGGIPKDEQSFAWTAENEISGKEPGVSVYDALYLKDGDRGWKWHLVMPSPITEKMMNTLYTLINYQKRQVYLVEGELVGHGSDNEPCIRDVQIVENITEQFKIRSAKSI